MDFLQTTTRSIILLEDCPTCIATQSMFVQLGTGIIYPLMSTIGGTYMVNMLCTYYKIKVFFMSVYISKGTQWFLVVYTNELAFLRKGLMYNTSLKNY